MYLLPDVINRYLRSKDGQTMVEYVFLLLLVALVVAAFFPNLTSALQDSYTRTAAAFPP